CDSNDNRLRTTPWRSFYISIRMCFADPSMPRHQDGFGGRLKPLNASKERIRGKEAGFVTSDILVFEIQRIISPAKRAKVSIYLRLRQGYHAATTETLSIANEIIRNFKLSPRDALHAASALLGTPS